MRWGWFLGLVGLGALVLYGVGSEVAGAPRSAKVPPGVALIHFGDLAGHGFPAASSQAMPGAFLRALPASVLQRDQQRVLIQGFMIPILNEKRLVRAFLLARSQATCCFGFPLQVADVVEVHMAGSPVEPMMDRVLSVTGTLRVHEHWEGACLVSIFQMEAEAVTPEVPLPSSSQVAAQPPQGRE